ncbi:MAG: ABC transporter permease [Candidatus Sumerlaeaceae bacterium]|nr:ABC transporter permease [Candidatus Sumerlaeaceae bacterium]
MEAAVATPDTMMSAVESPTRRAVRRFLRNRAAVVALATVILIILAAILGPTLVKWDANTPDYSVVTQPPSQDHWFGTDQLGRDMVARILAGARISLQIAFVAGLINLFIGVAYGATAGYTGGRVDAAMMRVVDVLYGVPTILVVILLMVYLDQGITNIYLAIGLTYWLNMARLVRAEVLSLKQRDFVQAARAMGARPARILALHILPNCAGVILVTLTLFIPEAIFTEAFLSYIGLGVPAPDASWGSLAADGTHSLRASPYLLLFPGLALCITMLAFNIVGDALRDAVGR